MKRGWCERNPVNWFWLTVGHQLAVDPGPMAATPMPGSKIGWFGH